jgi:hypothetical protein
MNDIVRADQNYPVADRSESTAIMQVIERAAMNPDVDIDKMERLLQMQERILNRNAHAAFSSALAMMQCDLPSIKENGAIEVNGTVRSKYAKFEDINDTVRPILQRYGFAVSFRVKQDASMITVTGILAHREGHSEETQICLPADSSGSKNSVQAIGSSVSYGKRYAMCALLNITSRGEDDDGVGAGSKEPKKHPDMEKFETEHLQNLRDAAMSGTESLTKAFAGIPASKIKTAFWLANSAVLKDAANKADKGVAQ